MKKWIMNLSALFKTLGFSKEKIETGLSAEEWKQVRESYLATYGTSLESDKALNEDVPVHEPEAINLTAEETAALAEALGVNSEDVPADAKAAAQKAAEIAAQKAKEVAALKNLPEPENPAQKVNALRQQLPLAGHHSKGYLFGVENELYSRKKWYNELMANPSHTLVQIGDAEAETFSKDFKAQTRALRERMDYHRANGTLDQLDFKTLSQGIFDGNDTLNNLNQFSYIQHRNDLVIAYFRSLPTVRDIFPVRSNVQDKEVAVGNIIGELSQGYRKGRIFKGSMEWDADLYKVDDLMFKFNFEDLIELEKMYIGYLNKDHSAIIKWTFIEWVMVHYGEQLIKEQNERNVVGMRLPQQEVTANPANFAADGVIAAILNSIAYNRVLPFFEIGAYNRETMLDTVEEFADKLIEVAGSSADSMKIYLNARHKRWYIRNYREKYGQDADFTGSAATLIDLDPSKIVWVPNMKNTDYLMWATEPGNIELLEDKPGEMLAFSFKEELEGVAVVSRWKEGAHVQKAGKQFSSMAALAEDNYQHQYLFCNAPIAEAVGEGRIVSASASLNVPATLDWFILFNDTDNNVTVPISNDSITLIPNKAALMYPELQEQNGVVTPVRWIAFD